MLQLVWNFSAAVGGGPSVAAKSSPEIGALDKAVVSVPNDGSKFTVDLQPAAAAKVLLLIVQSTPPSDKVTIKISDGAATPNETAALPLGSRCCSPAGRWPCCRARPSRRSCSSQPAGRPRPQA
jgi:hypothetical protein